MPVAIKSHDSYSKKKSMTFISELVHHIAFATSDARETSLLLQRLSIALQHFNAIRVKFFGVGLNERSSLICLTLLQISNAVLLVV